LEVVIYLKVRVSQCGKTSCGQCLPWWCVAPMLVGGFWWEVFMLGVINGE